MATPGFLHIWNRFKDCDVCFQTLCIFFKHRAKLRPENLHSLRMTLYSVSSCNRMNITVGWTSCGETNSRGNARRSKPWRTSTGFCWRMSYLRTWPSTFWAATGKTRWAPALLVLFFFPCLHQLLVWWCHLTYGSACFLSILSTPAHLCNPLRCCKPLVALSTLISSILTSVSLSESNYFFPAAVTPSQRWLNFHHMYF